MNISTKYAGVSTAEMKPFVQKLEPYRKQLARLHASGTFDAPECSLNLPFSKDTNHILSMAKKYRTKQLRTVVVVGIGGSNLGTQAIYEALGKKQVEILFLDTVSNTHFASVVSQLKTHKAKNQFLIVSISKSGGTTETIANTEALIASLKKPFGDVTNRMIVITDDDSRFAHAAHAHNIQTLTMPKMVGGRFSVFSAVGLFPLAVAGFDIHTLLQGAQEMVLDALSSTNTQNTARTLAIMTHIHATQNKTIHNTFFFAPELESIGKWERQLIGESLGKEFDLDGKQVNAGITPVVSIGSTDLHSMGQLYFGGPRNMFTTLVSLTSGTPEKKSVCVPQKQLLPSLVDHLAGKSLTEIMSAIVGGVTASYQKTNLPFVSISFDVLNEKTLGSYMQLRMMEIMYLAHVMHVNAFDQPNVEMYKTETRMILK